MSQDPLTGRIIGAATEVHKALGPGLLESAYQACLAYELEQQRIPFEQQVALPVEYKGVQLDLGYRMDFVVEDRVVLELKTVDAIAPVHEAQLLSYLKLSGHPIGLLINFHIAVLRDGIKRRILTQHNN